MRVEDGRKCEDIDSEDCRKCEDNDNGGYYKGVLCLLMCCIIK
jgi:hypothetical protein